MEKNQMNKDWYGSHAKVLVQEEDRVVVDYGCDGRGIVKNYLLFDGIQLCFLDFETETVFHTQKYHPDILEITHCRTGRYECTFANHTVTYVPEGCFSVAATQHLPDSFSFPLRKFYGVSLVIDQRALSKTTRQILQEISIDLDKITKTLELGSHWYVNDTLSGLRQVFDALYEAVDTEPSHYFKIKVLELLYHIDALSEVHGYDLTYFNTKQIQATKAIQNYLITHLDERVSLEKLAKEAHLNLSLFHRIFSHIYGDTPYAYLKKYKMNLAAQWLLEKEGKIGDIAWDLGYRNPSKFSKAFQSVYGLLPKEYRKNKKR